MQSLVGIVRRKEEMVRALHGLGKLRKRSQNVAVHGHREYNPGYLLTVSEAITRSGTRTQGEPRADISATIFQTRTRRAAK
jgi:succinate dehydrogenase/fumarate reductase flavoprotein subunit